MVDQIIDEDLNTKLEAEEDGKEGDGKSGRGGRSGGGGGGIRLPPNMLKQVVESWKHMDLAETAVRVAEFFSEMPARASANLSVNWNTAKRHGFAVVNHIIASGQEIAQLMRSREAGHIKRLRNVYGINVMKRATNAIQPMQPMPQ
jgi:hypothetical protein